jgi:[ribosomal protein S5]-alanine N-acetyltransferase
MLFSPFPQLHTSRILLRAITTADQSVVYKGLSDPQVNQYYGVNYASYEATAAQMDFYKQLLQDETGIWWAICWQDAPQHMLGACGFNYWQKQHQKIEIGYWLLPPYQGMGIMTEALPAIINYAFKLPGIHRIEAVVEEGNTSSNSLLQKLHFVYEGTLRQSEIKNGAYINLQYWALLQPA